MGCIKEADSSDYDATVESETDPSQNNQDEVGDPVNVVTGAFVLTETDILFPSQRLLISLVRHYNNQHHEIDKRCGPFGYGWTHSLNLYLVPGPLPFQITYVDDRGIRICFSINIPNGLVLSSSEYQLKYALDATFQVSCKNKVIGQFDLQGNQIVADAEKPSTLQIKAGNEFHELALVQSDQVLAIFDIPKIGIEINPPASALGMKLEFENNHKVSLKQQDGLTAIFSMDGKIESLIKPGPKLDSKIDFTYDRFGLLQMVNGIGGRFIKFSYKDALIQEVSDQTGRTWKYEYNQHQELVEVYSPGNRIRSYSYRSWKGQVSVGKGKIETREIRALEKIFPYFYAISSKNTIPELTLKYTSDQRVARQIDALGHVTRFNYNKFTRITTVVDPLGNTTVYCFNKAGNTTKVRRPRGGATEYIYDDSGNLLAEIDPIGNKTEYVEFKNPNRIDWKVDYGRRALGNRSAYLNLSQDEISVGYDKRGNRPLIRDALGNITRFLDYSAFGLPSHVILPDGTEIFYQYDERCGLPIRMERALQIGRRQKISMIQEWSYDDIGNLLRHVEWAQEPGNTKSAKHIKEFEYDSLGQPIFSRESIDKDGKGMDFATETKFGWDELGRLSEETELLREIPGVEPKPLSTKFGYDLMGREIWRIDPENIAHCNRYDLAGRLIESYRISGRNNQPPFEPQAQETQDHQLFEYDLMGREIWRIDPCGARTRLDWDANNHRVAVVDPLGFTTRYEYDRDGNQILEQQPGGYLINTDYDLAGRPIRQYDNLGQNILREYDPSGRLQCIIDKREETTAVTTYSYDALSRLKRIVFPDGTYSGFEIDERGKVTSRWRGSESSLPIYVEAYRYDFWGRQTEVLVGTPEKMTTQFEIKYNDSIREVRIIDALGNSTSTYFNSKQIPIRRTDGEGREIYLEYDKRMRLLRRKSKNEQIDSRYEYDISDRLIMASEEPITYEWKYDGAGRTIQHAQSIGSKAASVSYVYDNGGRLTQKEINNNWWFYLGYSDSSPFPVKIEIPDTTIELKTDISGRITQENWSTGGLTNYKYRPSGALTSIESYDHDSKLVFAQEFQLDNRGRNKQESRFISGHTFNYIYSYDQINRLSNIESEEKNGKLLEFRSYIYDERGNRIEERRQGKPFSSQKYDIANRLVERKVQEKTPEIYTYDRCGNLIKLDQQTFSYDAYQRLREVNWLTAPGKEVKYYYSATDQRVMIHRDDSHETIFYDGLQESVSDLKVESRASFWGFGLDSLIAVKESNQRLKRAFTDKFGSVVALGSQENFVNYDPFGCHVDGHSPYIFGFCGKRYDNETGFYYGRARQYDPEIGRYTQPDPIGTIDDINLYQYAQNNPLVYSDPLGLISVKSSQGSIATASNWTPSYGELTAAGLKDAHHIVMDAAVRGIPGYSRQDAPAIQLSGPSTRAGTAHYAATRAQMAGPHGTLTGQKEKRHRWHWQQRVYRKARLIMQSQGQMPILWGILG